MDIILLVAGPSNECTVVSEYSLMPDAAKK